ncbi:hypothetical protein Tco_0648802 [Tanacetum coccineum]
MVYPHGAIEITDKDRFSFKVNGQRLKKYYGGNIDKEDDEIFYTAYPNPMDTAYRLSGRYPVFIFSTVYTTYSLNEYSVYRHQYDDDWEVDLVDFEQLKEFDLLKWDQHKESSRRSVPVETSTSTALVSCDGLGGYDWSDQAEEGPNYALMAFSSSSPDSEVSNDSICLESVEEKLEVYKANKSIYLQDIKGLKFEIHIGEITIRELRKKLEIVQKEKDGIQLNVDKFKHASKSLNKLIECQIVDNCKKGLGYENYNVVPPPYIGNFMPPTLDLSFTSLDEFVNKPVVENCKAMSSEEEPKVVSKYDDAPSIKEWVPDDEEEDVSQPKTEKKTVRPSIVKNEFVKSKQQEKLLGKVLNKLSNIGKTLTVQEAIKEIGTI